MTPEQPFIERRAVPPSNPPFTWADMDKHMDDKLAPIHEKLDNIEKLLKSAFPDGNLDEHRRFHEEERRASADRQKLKSELFGTVAKWALQALMTAVGIIVVLGFQSQFNAMVGRAVDTPKAAPEVKK